VKKKKVVRAWAITQKGINILASELSFFDNATSAKACKRDCGDGFEVIKVKICHITPKTKRRKV